MIAGYEPVRIAALAQRAHVARRNLDGIRSSDRDAEAAMTAVGQLRHAVADALLPAVAAIVTTDPLAGAALRSTHAGDGWYRTWLESLFRARYTAMSDDELFAELEHLERDVPYDEDFQPDLDHSFWIGFEQLSIELSKRSSDAEFTDRLIERSRHSFLVPIAVGFARFDPATIGRMLHAVAVTPSHMVDLLSNFQAHGTNVLINALAPHPHIALDVLTDPATVKELVGWPTIDAGSVAAFIDAAMTLPFREPSHLADAFAVLQNLVGTANTRLHDDGFPPRLSPALAEITVRYLPFLITSLDGAPGPVHLKDFEFRDAGVPLGSYPDVLDFFGALMRDRASVELLMAAIPAVAVVSAENNGPLAITQDDLGDFVDTLGKAAANEQLEEQLKTERNERHARLAVDIAFGALETASGVSAPASTGVAIPISLLKSGTHALVGWVATERDLGLDDIRSMAFLLASLGLAVGVVNARGDRRRGSGTALDDAPRGPIDATDEDLRAIEDATEIVTTIERRMVDGASIHHVEGLVDDLVRIARSIDDEHLMAVLDDDRVLPPDVAVERQADLDG